MSNFASGYTKYINHLEQINHAAVNCPEKMIREVEGSYRDHLRIIAENIRTQHRGVKVVMLSGPSSSGKTTTAYLLRDYLAERGGSAHILSLDDFYRGVGLAPQLPDGTYDYEALEALNVDRIKSCLKDITTKGSFTAPVYSFSLGRPEDEEKEYQVDKDDIVIVEGLHALNPVLTGELPAEACLRLYVSVKQKIEDVNGEVMSPMDLRLVRRIVRDMRFRDTTAERTITMWPQVEAGEDRYIRPYRISADYTVNSIHIYEPCVLRTVTIPILREIAEDSLNYKKARDLEARLMRFEPIDPSLVPEGSMLREFLG